MKRILQWIGKATIAGGLAIILLSGFCLIYNYDGIHISSESGATDYIWEKGQLKSTMKEGFSWIRMDTNGYNNVFDYSEELDILLMGSSHMEAAQVSQTQNVGFLLNQKLPDYSTYNIGMSGHTIYRCMDNLENALQEYKPNQYVVMVVDSVDLSIEEMKDIITQEATPIPSYDSGFIYYMQKIPALKVIYKQITDWITLEGNTNNSNANSTKSKDTVMSESDMKENYNNTLKEFLGNAVDMCDEFGVTLILVYQPPQKLNNTGAVVYEHSEEKLRIFADECEAQGIVFCDMTERFTEMYLEDNVLAHGFLNSAVGEGHLNKYGHAVISDVIVEIIRELEE